MRKKCLLKHRSQIWLMHVIRSLCLHGVLHYSIFLFMRLFLIFTPAGIGCCFDCQCQRDTTPVLCDLGSLGSKKRDKGWNRFRPYFWSTITRFRLNKNAWFLVLRSYISFSLDSCLTILMKRSIKQTFWRSLFMALKVGFRRMHVHHNILVTGISHMRYCAHHQKLLAWVYSFEHCFYWHETSLLICMVSCKGNTAIYQLIDLMSVSSPCSFG